MEKSNRQRVKDSLTLKVPGGCWIWKGPRHPRSGAPSFCWDGKWTLVNRAAVWKLKPGERVVLSCQNPLCINPAHRKVEKI